MGLENLTNALVASAVKPTSFKVVKKTAANLNTAASGLVLANQLSKLSSGTGTLGQRITNLGAGVQQVAAGLGLPRNLGIPASLGGVSGILTNASFLAGLFGLDQVAGFLNGYGDGVDPYTKFSVDPSWDTSTLEGLAHFRYNSSDLATIKKLQETKKILDPQVMDAVISSDRVKLDLIISSIQFGYSDFQQLSPHLGETFTHRFFGRTPVVITITGNLLDSVASNGKYVLTHLYERLFRAVKAARYQVSPTLMFHGCAVTGPFLSMSLSEQSGMEDVIGVSIQMLALKIVMCSPLNRGRSKSCIIDFTSNPATLGTSQTVEQITQENTPAGIAKKAGQIKQGAFQRVDNLLDVFSNSSAANNPASWKIPDNLKPTSLFGGQTLGTTSSSAQASATSQATPKPYYDPDTGAILTPSGTSIQSVTSGIIPE